MMDLESAGIRPERIPSSALARNRQATQVWLVPVLEAAHPCLREALGLGQCPVFNAGVESWKPNGYPKPEFVDLVWNVSRAAAAQRGYVVHEVRRPTAMAGLHRDACRYWY